MNSPEELRVLIATDVLSEGQNLQVDGNLNRAVNQLKTPTTKYNQKAR